ncbi:MAG: MFS transporter [Chloroflexi bacterium]|nr:MFS transporter [Chloroflexota bacterium]MDA1239498.1 MFS transporter [Chloroflexota bacterium]
MQRNLRILPWWWVLRWAYLGEAIWVLYLTDERGLTLGQVLVIETVAMLFAIAAEVPTGMVADRFGRRVSLVTGSAVGALAMLVFGLATEPILLIVSFALFGLAVSLFSGAEDAMLFDSLQAEGRGDEFTAWNGRLNALVTTSMAVLTVAGSVMIIWTPLAFPFVLSALFTAPSVVLAWRLREPPRSGTRHTYLETGRLAVRLVLRSRSIPPVMVLMTLTTLPLVVMTITLPRVIVDFYRLPLWTVGGFVAAHLASAALAGFLSARLGGWLGLRRLFLLVPASSALALLAGATGLLWLAPVFMLSNFAWNLMWPHFVDYVSRRVPDSLRATSLSIASVVAGLGYAAALPALGFGIDRLGLSATLVIGSFVFAAATSAVYAAWLRAGDVEARPIIVDAPDDPAVPSGGAAEDG